MNIKNKIKINKKLYKSSLRYHKFPIPGKISIKFIKKINNKKDLTLAYSPGVACVCQEIKKKKKNAFKYTSKGNLIGVISNGTAVLGLGNIGALASKPVMEGKSILFKKFANIDAFDIEINENNPYKLCNIIKSLEPTFGAINLEDIKAPECFYIEKKLNHYMNIPVFHDDQHGTAIIVCSAIINSLKLIKKNIKNIKLVVSGAGAASLSCLNYIINIGLKKNNIFIIDLSGVIYKNRDNFIDKEKKKYENKTKARNLLDIIINADIFLGLSSGGILKSKMINMMNYNPIIFALANPIPEIFPEKIRKIRLDSIIATGRSDYPNQVNNVLCFPYIFRGALDSKSKSINYEMKMATIYSIYKFTRTKKSLFLNKKKFLFNSRYIIPSIFDYRLILEIAPSVVRASKFSKNSQSNINILNYIKYLKTFFLKKNK